MSNQLALFELPEPKPTARKAKAKANSSEHGAFHIVPYQNEYYKETHYAVWYNGTNIGWMFLVGGKTYSLHFPQKNWCCGFGIGSLKQAAEEMYRCWLKEGKEVARA